MAFIFRNQICAISRRRCGKRYIVEDILVVLFSLWGSSEDVRRNVFQVIAFSFCCSINGDNYVIELKPFFRWNCVSFFRFFLNYAAGRVKNNYNKKQMFLQIDYSACLVSYNYLQWGRIRTMSVVSEYGYGNVFFNIHTKGAHFKGRMFIIVRIIIIIIIIILIWHKTTTDTCGCVLNNAVSYLFILCQQQMMKRWERLI